MKLRIVTDLNELVSSKWYIVMYAEETRYELLRYGYQIDNERWFNDVVFKTSKFITNYALSAYIDLGELFEVVT